MRSLCTMSRQFRTPKYRPLQKFNVICSGLYIAAVTDFSVAYKVVLSAPILGSAFLFRRWIDVSIILLAVGLVLMAELFNSAIEVLCDFVEPQKNERIRITKDISAAAVGISIMVWAAVLVVEVVRLIPSPTA